MEFTAKDVMALRERSGAGMMDCKKALKECDGDIEKALDYLREKSLAASAKKASRIAAEGIVDCFVCEKCGGHGVGVRRFEEHHVSLFALDLEWSEVNAILPGNPVE